MSSRRGLRRLPALSLFAALLGGVVISACSSTGSASGTQANLPVVSFDPRAAAAFDGTIPTATAVGTCGSAQYGWMSELLHVEIAQATDDRHWAFIVPTKGGLAAKPMEASGTATNVSIGSTDVPFDHPFGGDLNFDEKLDAPYAALNQNVGPDAATGNPSSTLHDELMSGLAPHLGGQGNVAPGTSWPDFAMQAGRSIAPGFTPVSGDRVAAEGAWVIDCGHTDFHSELHSIQFLAFGHVQGSATVAHAFYNPYEEAQLFNPDPSLAGKVSQPGNLTLASSQNMYHYLVTEVVRLAQGKDSQPIAPVMLEANTTSPSPWVVCAPPGSKGTLSVSYDFSVARGVDITVRPNDSSGCATVTSTLSSSYHPADAPGQVECPTDWSWIDQNAFGEANTFGGTGNSSLDIPNDILNTVKSTDPALAAPLEQHIGQPLLSLCFPSLTVPSLPSPGPGRATITTSGQIMPLAGWIEVDRG